MNGVVVCTVRVSSKGNHHHFAIQNLYTSRRPVGFDTRAAACNRPVIGYSIESYRAGKKTRKASASARLGVAMLPFVQ